MKLFEASWMDNYQCFARLYDTESKTSQKVEVDNHIEYFTPCSQGTYSCVIDNGLKYTKRLGSWKDARDQVGVTQPQYRYIRDNFWTFDNTETAKYNMSPRVWYLDIETRALGEFPDPMEAKQEVTLVQIYDNKNNTMIVIGRKDFKTDLVPHEMQAVPYKTKYIKASSEVELFNLFIEVFKRLDPLVIYAWNGNGFDYPYLYHRMKKLGLDINQLSNYGSVSLKVMNSFPNKRMAELTSCGHVFLDLLEVYKNNIRSPRASYSLDNISTVELGDQKVQHEEFLNFDSFYTGERYKPSETAYSNPLREAIRQAYLSKDPEFYDLIFCQFVYYGTQDVYLLKRLDDKLKFTQLILMQTSMIGCQIQDVMGTIKPWAVYISNIAMLDNMVVPAKEDHDDQPFKGGFVREPQVGKHKWVMNVDVNSMYPMLAMVGFNISPETYVPIAKLPEDLRSIVLKYFNDEDEDVRLCTEQKVWDAVKPILQRENLSLSVNGACYDRTKDGLLPRVIRNIYTARKQTKKEMHKVEQFIAVLDALKCTGTKKFNSLDYKNYKNFTSDTGEPATLEELDDSERQRLIRENTALAEQLNVKQLVLKVMINALYGAEGNKHFIFYNREVAASVTANGRFFIKKLANYINDKLQSLIPAKESYITYGDTDSDYYHIEPFVDLYKKKHPDASLDDCVDFCIRFEEGIIVPVIEKCIHDYAEQFNAPHQDAMGAKREVVCDVVINVAKKRYTARVIDAEGVRFDKDHAHLKVMGLDLVRSMTPKWCVKNLTDSVSLLFDADEHSLMAWMDEIKKSFTAASIPDIAAHQGVSSLNYDLKKSKAIPINSRSALVYNKFITDHKLLDSLAPIQAGEKIKRVFLTTPNPFDSDSIAWIDDRFCEYIKNYIDWDTCFEKFFKSPLRIMTEALNYNIDNRNSSWDDWL